jgi:hypothetical protein
MRIDMVPHLRAECKRGRLEQFHQRRCECVDIVGGDQLTRKLVGQNIANPAGVGRDTGQTAGHGFEQGVGHAFLA